MLNACFKPYERTQGNTMSKPFCSDPNPRNGGALKSGWKWTMSPTSQSLHFHLQNSPKVCIAHAIKKDLDFSPSILNLAFWTWNDSSHVASTTPTSDICLPFSQCESSMEVRFHGVFFADDLFGGEHFFKEQSWPVQMFICAVGDMNLLVRIMCLASVE